MNAIVLVTLTAGILLPHAVLPLEGSYPVPERARRAPGPPTATAVRAAVTTLAATLAAPAIRARASDAGRTMPSEWKPPAGSPPTHRAGRSQRVDSHRDAREMALEEVARQARTTRSDAERLALLAKVIDLVLPGADPREWLAFGAERCQYASEALASGHETARAYVAVWGARVSEQIGSPAAVGVEAMVLLTAVGCPDVFDAVGIQILRALQ